MKWGYAAVLSLDSAFLSFSSRTQEICVRSSWMTCQNERNYSCRNIRGSQGMYKSMNLKLKSNCVQDRTSRPRSNKLDLDS